MDLQRYVLTVAYDGTAYFGWQVQQGQPSIAQTLQDTFKRIFNHEAKIVGASRTDAGVHARAQVAICTTTLALDAQKLLHAWRNRLPADIIITSLTPAPEWFHPQRGVVQKTYHYHFFQEMPLPFVCRYGWHVPYVVDLEKLQAALQIFVGTHDFRSFCTGDEMGENCTRRIDEISLEYIAAHRMHRIVVKGPGFLRHMIRRIVGACLQVAGDPHAPVSVLQEALSAHTPRQTLMNAPAQGLMLYCIDYERSFKE